MMKPTSKLLVFSIALLFTCSTVTVQAQGKIPKWLPENGNWMVETNINQPLHSIIYFYTNNGEVIYKETLDGFRLNLEKRKVRMRLKKVLETALTAWHKNKQVMQEQQWVAVRFR